ncbi:hypothetical protein [Ferrovibrio xuzhouensis]|uniref:Uncharacterized protein n=1 Tax=Ferrovibrio xuzhouensis TaxID=1576914 RepID=A0ABV7VJJ6_9PROT
MTDSYALAEDERRVLECLGAAVVLQWNELPMPLQRDLFRAAAAAKTQPDPALKTAIARFLHLHKDDPAS